MATVRTHSASAEQKRRSYTHVDKLLAERNDMMSIMCKLAGIEPYTVGKRDKPIQATLQEFCQILVDYIAAGHFALYERISSGKERRKEVSAVATRVYPEIARITDVALDFNDKYDTEEHCKVLDHLSQDLKLLGEHLARRMELEDELIDALRAPRSR